MYVNICTIKLNMPLTMLKPDQLFFSRSLKNAPHFWGFPPIYFCQALFKKLVCTIKTEINKCHAQTLLIIPESFNLGTE